MTASTERASLGRGEAGEGRLDLNTSPKDTLVFHADGFTSIETSGPQVVIILAIGGRVPSATVNYGHGVFTQFPNGFLRIDSQTGAQFDICAALT